MLKCYRYIKCTCCYVDYMASEGRNMWRQNIGLNKYLEQVLRMTVHPIISRPYLHGLCFPMLMYALISRHILVRSAITSKFMNKLFSHRYLCLPSCLFPSGFSTRSLYALLLSLVILPWNVFSVCSQRLSFTPLLNHKQKYIFFSILWSSGQSSWLQIRRPGFDSRHYQKKK
jgi:hypothetical protein